MATKGESFAGNSKQVFLSQLFNRHTHNTDIPSASISKLNTIHLTCLHFIRTLHRLGISFFQQLLSGNGKNNSGAIPEGKAATNH
jgi:hypothetical protein